MPFIVLELVEGPTLHDVLKERRPSIAEIVQWGREIASALDHAHRRGVIHRDLKSANVALSPDGAVKVLDFGLSRRTVAGDEVAQSPAAILTDASVAGTLTHIAPEVLRREPLDARVDLWALGVMLYEMTSGVLPFKRSTAFETAEAILHAAPDPLPSHVPTHLQRLILRCLAKDPDSRVATAAELRVALTALQADVRDRPRAARLWATATGVLGVIVVAGTLYNSRQLLRPAIMPPTLAILPLANAAGDADQGFFADGFVALEQAKMQAGRANEFDQRIAELIVGLPESYAPPSAIANALFTAGRIDEGFKWLESAYNERTNNIVYLGVEPVYDLVRDDPRFQVLMRAVGLP